MAIGVATGDEFEKELSRFNSKSESKTPDEHEIKDIKTGRGNKEEVPIPVKKIIGETAIQSGRKAAVELAEELGISKQSADAYAHGATSLSTYNDKDNEVGKYTDGVRRLITSSARQTLLSALQSITADKLQDTTPRVAAGIARDMSSVIKNIEPEPEKEAPVKFVLLAPPMKEEKEFEVIEVND